MLREIQTTTGNGLMFISLLLDYEYIFKGGGPTGWTKQTTVDYLARPYLEAR